MCTANVYGLPKKSNLRILTLNCQRILGKTAELAAALKYLKPDIVCGTESWLHGIKPGANPSPDHVKSSEVFPEEYNVFRKDRNCLGGGIFILIHKSLTAVEQPELSTDCEILWAKLKLQNRKDLNVGCFYMPHRNKHDIEQLDKSINLLTQNSKKDCPIVLAGDFNCPHINWINHTTHSTGKDNDIQQSLVDIMQSSTLTHVHHSPTRFMNILDLIFFSNPSLVKSSVSVPGISDHEMIVTDADTRPQRTTPLAKKCFQTLQLTLAILKPDVVAQPHIVQAIRLMILQRGFYFVQSQQLHLTRARAEDFYQEHRGKFFLNRLVSFMNSGPIWTHILAGEDAVPQWRQLMGPTKVLKTIYEAPDSIRGQFGLTDTRNCCHGSDSEATAKREMEFFFPEFSIDGWHRDMEEAFLSGQVQFDEEACVHRPLGPRASES
ncbi:hypothetical protein ACOMHN_004343 [Nucella lapillus]